MFDHSALETAFRNLSYMTGNTWLAWLPVLLYEAMHDRRHALPATAVIVFGGAGAALVRLRDASPLTAIVVAVALALAAAAWLAFARRGATWARVLAILAIVAFTPNAPYVLTDTYHFQQDVRATGMPAGGIFLLAAEYAVFLVVAASAWIVILDRGRDLLVERRPRWPRLAILTLVSLVSAFGIYLGRIVRLNSWDPIGHSGRVGDAISTAVTHAGPMAFTFVWAAVILVVGAVGLTFVRRTHATRIRGRQLVAPLIGCVFAALLAGGTIVGRVYEAYGVVTPHPSRHTIVLCLVASVVVGAVAGGWLVSHLGVARASEGAAASAFVLPVLGVALVWAASTMWWAQYRGLCHFGPAFNDRGDRCAYAQKRPL
ncbi:MAG: hypothetical protein JWN72_2944 [Thermoleophilia bacterium]|nr:hypothetical protein [Thermoleophilia bacterium]